ncbi:hypothetical protein TorRG33x02_216720 [Trema orientale]|uniref:Uncharacterized protein n=1 Tax=Trema orientale TaxID=63057 RepID=A0A2P5EAD9_TREOI|nr:hypothetical protein TorRG33x02_216720 [Trema orientale]
MTISSSHHLIDESVKALDEIEGISGEVYAKAIDKFENELHEMARVRDDIAERIWRTTRRN